MTDKIHADSIRQADKGFQNVAIGKLTHSKLRQLANSQGVSMASLIKEYVERESSGQQGELLTHRVTVSEVKQELAESKGATESIARFMATMLAQVGDYESGRYSTDKEKYARGLERIARAIRGNKGEVAHEQELGLKLNEV